MKKVTAGQPKDQAQEKFRRLVEEFGPDKALRITLLACALHEESKQRVRGIRKTS